MRQPRRPVADVGVALFEQRFEKLAVIAAPVRPRGWLSGKAPSNFGCGASPNPCVLGATRAGLSNSARCSPSGWTSGREALDLGPEDLGPEDLGPEDLGPEDLGPAADFRGAGMSGIWGELRGRGKGKRTSFVASIGSRLKLACRCPLATVRHPGERDFARLLISPAISRIRASASTQKDIQARTLSPREPERNRKQ